MKTFGMIATLLLTAVVAGGQHHETKKDPMADCPLHAQHAAKGVVADGSHAHGREVDGRHDTFGMSHQDTHHRFRLFRDGGAIELHANDAAAAKTIATIRTHLKTIVEEFAKGDFKTPAFVHGYAPAGVDAMKTLGAVIDYRYEELPDGGRIRITTKDAKALAAVHGFLKFQVIEHRTGDPGEIEEAK